MRVRSGGLSIRAVLLGGIGRSGQYPSVTVKTFSGRFLRHGAAVGVVALLALTACTSDPNSKRVAEDLIKTLAPNAEVEECMLDVLEGYSSDELDDLGKAINDGDLDEQSEAAGALAQYEADLAACNE